MGGGKGGSDFDPKGKSDAEVMRFCQSFMTELYRHIGQFTDVPAGDIGVGAREVGLHVRPVQEDPSTDFYGGVHHRQGPDLRRLPGSYRGYRLRSVLLRIRGTQPPCKRPPSRVRRSSSPAPATLLIYAAEKCTQLGAKVVTAMRDSNGYIYDPDGVELKKVMDIKQKRRGTHQAFTQTKFPAAEYHEGRKGIWTLQVRHRNALRIPERDGR